MDYQNQQLDFTITLANEEQSFSNGSRKVTYFSPRSTAIITAINGTNSGKASFRIWGLTRETIATITNMGIWRTGDKLNKIEVKANGATVYQGVIANCVADFNQAPDISVSIDCYASAFLMIEVAKPFSFNGEVKASQAIESIIKPFGMTLINNGVTSSLSNPYISGSPYNQIMEIANSVGCLVIFEYDTITLHDKDYKPGDPVITISPETGLIGYPMYFSYYLTIKTYFNPSYKVGKPVNLITSLPLATGKYIIGGIEHNLSCNLIGGLYESNLLLYKVFN
ncbi:baseplate hub protein [Orbus mooreae]|uniref:baseplate hub protein n=1 Tax=Orbus mooreae TaxID=3074107 RepID=UPI00370CFC36